MRIICKICNKSFENDILLNNHVVNEHKLTPIEYRKVYETVPQSIIELYNFYKKITNNQVKEVEVKEDGK